MISSRSVIEEKVSLGRNTKIWHFCNIYGDVQIGDDCAVGSYVELRGVQGRVKIGDRVKIHSFSFIDGPATLEDDVFIGGGVIAGNQRYPPFGTVRGVHIMQGAIIGNGATLLPGVIIGKNAVVGAGATVSSDVADNCLVVGFPARVVGDRTSYNENMVRWK